MSFVLLNSPTFQNVVVTFRLPIRNGRWHVLAPEPCLGTVWEMLDFHISFYCIFKDTALTQMLMLRERSFCWYVMYYISTTILIIALIMEAVTLNLQLFTFCVAMIFNDPCQQVYYRCIHVYI